MDRMTACCQDKAKIKEELGLDPSSSKRFNRNAKQRIGQIDRKVRRSI
jgi:hypothetical protein